MLTSYKPDFVVVWSFYTTLFENSNHELIGSTRVYVNKTKRIKNVLKMSNRVASKDNLSFVCVDVRINPSGPRSKRPTVCIENLKPRVDMVAFLIIVFPVNFKKNATS